jgi:hypothetical protein
MRSRRAFPLSLLLLPAALGAQQDRTRFDWTRALAAGKTLEIIGVNGGIVAEGGSGREVEVHATKRGHKSDPASVTFEVVEHPDGVTICAMYPAGDRRPNECLPGGKGRSSTRNNDVEVEWTVKIPAGVRFAGRTVNGRVEARGLAAPAVARTVNGSIFIETTSWAEASTVNGSVTARLGRADWDGEKAFTTVNGSITLSLPADAGFEVQASNVNGSLSTDFPLTIQGKWGPRRMSGTVGTGGRRLSMSSVNGNLELRKA